MNLTIMLISIHDVENCLRATPLFTVQYEALEELYFGLGFNFHSHATLVWRVSCRFHYLEFSRNTSSLMAGHKVEQSLSALIVMVWAAIYSTTSSSSFGSTFISLISSTFGLQNCIHHTSVSSLNFKQTNGNSHLPHMAFTIMECQCYWPTWHSARILARSQRNRKCASGL